MTIGPMTSGKGISSEATSIKPAFLDDRIVADPEANSRAGIVDYEPGYPVEVLLALIGIALTRRAH